MTTRAYGDKQMTWLPSWIDPKDKGVMRLMGCVVSDINLRIGWGSSSSSCSLTLVEEVEGSFNHPHMGSPVRVSIENRNENSTILYDRNNPEYSLSFIGIVKAADEEEGSGGRVKKISLLDTKEILKNIPVITGRMSTDAQASLGKINNITYAHDVDKSNHKGLDISAVATAVEAKTYTYFPNNSTEAGSDSFSLQQYKIDMSEMFGQRDTTSSTSNYANFAIYTTEAGRYQSSFDDSNTYLDSAGRTFCDLYGMCNDDDIDVAPIVPPELQSGNVDDQKYICSPTYKIEGYSSDLIEIIDRAMSENGCDWYVRAYVESDPTGLSTTSVTSTVVIKIIPVVRNRFDQLSRNEFDTFVGVLANVKSSEMFGTELINGDTNKAFFGSRWEILQKAMVNYGQADGFKQFWGFKKQQYDEGLQEIQDTYGNTVQVRNGINSMPTFDTSEMRGVQTVDALFPTAQLRRWLNVGFGYTEATLDIYDRTELIEIFASETDFLDEYTFNLDDTDEEYFYYLLANSLDTVETFGNLLLSMFSYRDTFDDHESGFSTTNAFVDIENGRSVVSDKFKNVRFWGQTTSVGGSTITIPAGTASNPSIEFDFYGDDIDYITSCVVDNGEGKPLYVQVYPENTNEIFESVDNLMINTKSSSSDFGDIEKISYGLNAIKIRVQYRSLSREKIIEDCFYFSINWSEAAPSTGNVDSYYKVAQSPLYAWGRALAIKIIMGNHINSNANEFSIYTDYFAKDKGTEGKKLMLLNQYQEWQSAEFTQRLEQLYNLVKKYVDEYTDVKYYRELVKDRWEVIPSAWDGVSGYQITNKYVRGKFINKKSGKMPALYRIRDPKNLTTADLPDDVLAIRSQDNTSDTLNIYGKIDTEVYAVGKTEEEAEDHKYLICTLKAIPKRVNKPRYSQSVDTDEVEEEARRTNSQRAIDDYIGEKYREVGIGNIVGGNSGSQWWMRAALRVRPTSFYIPTKHMYIRYGPWILDYRRNEENRYGSQLIANGDIENRSNYGGTQIKIDDKLNPWEFKSFGDVQNYILDQNQNSLMTEYRSNRGQIVTADIPRFNIGHKIGNFSNISSISISYGIGGVSTTYSLTAFGVGENIKEEREKQKIYKRLRNIEKVIDTENAPLTEQEINDLIGSS